MLVPSLYVRVYLKRASEIPKRRRSLIICEGVSRRNCSHYMRRTFPHYMWGCIAQSGAYTLKKRVPSLYVRVYRQTAGTVTYRTSSLIICEGVSYTPGRRTERTWVPSLYVRVYRVTLKISIPGLSSLIICEGVSSDEPTLYMLNPFPHYMWGCIHPVFFTPYML